MASSGFPKKSHPGVFCRPLLWGTVQTCFFLRAGHGQQDDVSAHCPRLLSSPAEHTPELTGFHRLTERLEILNESGDEE